MHGSLSRTVVTRWVGSGTLFRAVAGLTTLAVLGSFVACGSGEVDDPRVPERWASSVGAPYTQSPFLRLVGDSTACLVDSYEAQVVCGGPAWQDVTRFGREGRGPGEFNAIQAISSLSSDRLGVVDFGNQRVTVLGAGGRIETTISFAGSPSLVRAAGDSAMLVAELDGGQWATGDPAAGRRTRVARIQPGSWTLRWDTLVLPDTVPVTGIPLAGGAWSPQYGYVFLQYPYRMLRFSPTGAFLGTLTPAHFEPELPSDQDVEERIADLTKLFGRPPSGDAIDEWRAQPKRGVMSVQHVTFSEDGVLWIGTSRDRTLWSYIDAYDEGGSAFLGSVRVHDRLLAFDVRDGTLAALVEGEDSSGVPMNRIDWYTIGPWVDSLERSNH